MRPTIPHLVDARIRPATPQDVPRLIGLVTELARHVGKESKVQVTAEQLHDALFGQDPALYALVASDRPDGEVVGCAVWFLNFSTWLGVHGIYLEDLYVSPSHRGTGLGRALLQSLAVIAQHNGFGRVEWSVLTWNEPSIGFYRSLGAVGLDDSMTMRLSGAALAGFAHPSACAAD